MFSNLTELEDKYIPPTLTHAVDRYLNAFGNNWFWKTGGIKWSKCQDFSGS